MLFVKTTPLLSSDILLIRSVNSLFSQNSFIFYESISLLDLNNNVFSYFVCIEYRHMLIIYAYMIVSIMLDQYTSIDYIKSINSIMLNRLVNPGLLILSIYGLFYMETLFVLVLEVNTPNLDALSLYYWFGFQLSRQRSNYYNIRNLSNTAYILVNIKFSSKNMFRHYFL